jgi:hypothetical protein
VPCFDQIRYQTADQHPDPWVASALLLPSWRQQW